jgi:hypothetical protein
MKRQHPPVYYHVQFMVRLALIMAPGVAVAVLMHGKAFLG